MTRLVLAIGAVCLLLVFLFARFTLSESKTAKLKVFVAEEPGTLDPIAFDLFKHHAIQSLVTSKLVSFYRESIITPVVAESWTALSSNREWRFRIRKGLTTRLGVGIDASFVAKSLIRICYLLKQQQTRLTFVSDLVDFEHLVSASPSNFRGISAERDEVVFRFAKPNSSVLETLAFGIFGIVGPENFDSQTGAWRSRPNVDFSGTGPYEFISGNSDSTELRLRSDCCESLRDEKAFKMVELVHSKARIAEVDLGSGPEDSELYPKNLNFYGRGESSILYLFFHPWKSKVSPFSDIEFRRALRGKIQEKLRDKGYEITNSFFPKFIAGVAEPKTTSDLGKTSDLESIKISFIDVRPSKSKSADDALDALESAISSIQLTPLPKRIDKFEEIRKNKDPNLSSYSLDIGAYTTGISPADPEGDIRLMFSKEGIWLPDPSGKIGNALNHETVPIQDINQALYDDAVIIPIKHIALGFWADPRLDLSKYNSHHPLGELQWIGTK